MKHPLMERLKVYGYPTQRSVTRALCAKVSRYNNTNPKTLSAFLNQILMGRRSMPGEMVDGLKELCNQDEKVLLILQTQGYIGRVSLNVPGYTLLRTLEVYYQELKKEYVEMDDAKKLRVLTDFEEFVRNHTGLEAKVE